MANRIHLVDGEKGGVGKSMFTRLLVEFNQKYDLLYTLIDGDFKNPDVQQRYPEYGAQVVALVEDEEKFFDIDIIFETALETPVIVNLPARVGSLINIVINITYQQALIKHRNSGKPSIREGLPEFLYKNNRYKYNDWYIIY